MAAESFTSLIIIFYHIKVIKTMKNYDKIVEINHNPNWPYIPDNPYRILIIGGLG